MVVTVCTCVRLTGFCAAWSGCTHSTHSQQLLPAQWSTCRSGRRIWCLLAHPAPACALWQPGRCRAWDWLGQTSGWGPLLGLQQPGQVSLLTIRERSVIVTVTAYTCAVKEGDAERKGNQCLQALTVVALGTRASGCDDAAAHAACIPTRQQHCTHMQRTGQQAEVNRGAHGAEAMPAHA